MKSYHILLAQKPFKGNFASNAINELPSGINIDVVRITIDSKEKDIIDNRSGSNSGLHDGIYHDGVGKRVVGEIFKSHNDGRFPANIILTSCKEIDLQGKEMGSHSAGGLRKKNVFSDYEATSYSVSKTRQMNRFGNEGGVSRFFKRVKK